MRAPIAAAARVSRVWNMKHQCSRKAAKASGGSAAARWILFFQIRRRDLGDVQQFRRRLRYRGESVAEHRIAERAGRAHLARSGSRQFPGARMADAVALFLAQEGQPAAGAAAETALAGALRIDHFARQSGHRARLLENTPVAAQIARIVKHDPLSLLAGQLVDVARQEFTVMLDRRGLAELLPVGGDGAHAVRAD